MSPSEHSRHTLDTPSEHPPHTLEIPSERVLPFYYSQARRKHEEVPDRLGSHAPERPAGRAYGGVLVEVEREGEERKSASTSSSSTCTSLMTCSSSSTRLMTRGGTRASPPSADLRRGEGHVRPHSPVEEWGHVRPSPGGVARLGRATRRRRGHASSTRVEEGHGSRARDGSARELHGASAILAVLDAPPRHASKTRVHAPCWGMSGPPLCGGGMSGGLCQAHLSWGMSRLITSRWRLS